MTWFLAGAAILALTYAIGLRARTAAAQATAPPWPLESDGIDIPIDGPNVVVIPMQRLKDEIDLAMWEQELRGVDD